MQCPFATKLWLCCCLTCVTPRLATLDCIGHHNECKGSVQMCEQEQLALRVSSYCIKQVHSHVHQSECADTLHNVQALMHTGVVQ
jgi:hypothetical protein